MNDRSEKQSFDGLLDLRELTLTLWEKKWIIIGATFLIGLIAFLVSFFLIPKRYVALSFISITEPSLKTELETSIQTNLIELETGGLSDLAQASELRELTFMTLGVMNYQQKQAYELTASILGEGQLRLEVIANDPSQAADAANAWANVVSERINEIYSFSEENLEILEEEVEHAKDNWLTSQSALENFLPSSRLDYFTAKYSSASALLNEYLLMVNDNKLLISDALTIIEQLEDRELTDPLDTGTAIGLIMIQQRAGGMNLESSIQLQVDPLGRSEIYPDEALVVLNQLVTALHNQNQQLTSEIDIVSKEISELVVSLEEEEFLVGKFTQERDLSWNAYVALANQLEESKITMSQDGMAAQISAKAIPMEEETGLSTLMITASSLVIGLLIICGLILLLDFWGFLK